MKVLTIPCIRVGADQYVGTVKLSDLREHFQRHWIPDYQRERVMRKQKVNELIALFQENGMVDAVKLNFRGDYKFAGTTLSLDSSKGHVAIIDGLQRILAALDSGVDDYTLPLELYINLNRAQEIDLFHQFNRKGTPLQNGEMIKSLNGTLAAYSMGLVSTLSPLPVATYVKSTRGVGMSLVVQARILKMIHTALVEDYVYRNVPQIRECFELFDQKIDSAVFERTRFVFENLWQQFVAIFGTYTKTATIYKPVFTLPIMRLFLLEFVNRNTLAIEFGRHGDRIRNLPSFLNTARAKEISFLGSNSSSLSTCTNALYDFLNQRLTASRLTNRLAGVSWRNPDGID